MRVTVIGLGNIGMATAEYLSKQGLVVSGVDIKQDRIDLAERKGIHAYNDLIYVPKEQDGIVICVNTNYDKNGPNMESIEQVCMDISMQKYVPTFVAFESTLFLGTTRKMSSKYLEKVPHIITSPHRWWSKDEYNYGVKVFRVLGTLREGSQQFAYNLYVDVFDIPVMILSSVEMAEMTKITENGRRYVDIAFSEAIKIICDKYGLEFNELRAAVNTHFAHDMKYVKDGIGGECLPLAVNFLNELADIPIFSEVIKTDDEYIRSLKKDE